MSQYSRFTTALGAGAAALALSTTLHAAGPSKLDVANTFNTNIFIGEGAVRFA
ncbi:hypothetical protein [Marinobacterium weihaiense]|uniref:hypothetical protein n=1 Tax=Marinobacterium weihaiense TaxID=2851016 RepID=UPI0020B64E3A|nr:hypothetical protein [Marinobacterium weihaiense]